MSFIAAAVIGVGGSLLGSVIGGNASRRAANTAANAATRASEASLALQREQWQQGRADQEPWRFAGSNALAWMQDPANSAVTPWRNFTMADYQQDPGYGFRLSEGMKGLERSAAARGGLLSGSALKGITRYGQDYASDEYSRAEQRYNANQMNQLTRGDMPYNRRAALAGIGQTSATNMANQGMAYGINAGNTAAAGINAAGQANAAGQLGQGAAWQGGINNVMSAYRDYNMMNWLRPPPSP